MNTLQDRINRTLNDRSYLIKQGKYVNGDQWLNGEGWIGPTLTKPKGSNDDVAYDEYARIIDLANSEIERQFTTRNVLQECVERHTSGIVGRTPRLITEDDETQMVLDGWAELTMLGNVFERAVNTLMWAGQNDTLAVSPVRMYLPKRFTTRVGDVETIMLDDNTVESAMSVLRVHSVNPAYAGIIYDDDELPICSVYQYSDSNAQKFIEVSGTASALAEWGMYSGDASNETVLQIYQNTLAGTPIAETTYDLGGNLLMFEMQRPVMITDSAIALQKLVNLSFTMMARNVISGGHVERYITNAERPGKYVDRSTGEEVAASNSNSTFRPDPLYVGSGTTNFLAGLPRYDDAGNEVGFNQVGVFFREPSPVDTFISTIQQTISGIYHECDQAHVMIQSEATASGFSRVQATNDFVLSLQQTAGSVSMLGSWIGETSLRWAGYLTNTPMEDVNVTCEPHIAAVQPTANERVANLQINQAGLMSNERFLQLEGLENVDTELQLINQSDDGVDEPEPEEDEGEFSVSS